MRYGSVCSGIESASVAWEPLGFEPAWFSEIEAFPSAVLAHHYSNVQNLGDMTQLPAMVRMGLIEAPDVLVGGTPCQAFSIAGKRESLGDERGQLTLTYVDLLDAIDEMRTTPATCVWENVPGVLNTKDNAFGCFLGALAGEDVPLEPAGKKWTNAGYVLGPKRAIAWRVLDAQYFGLAQRRKRVFLVASAREGFDPRKVLFESEGVRRDTPPSRETREDFATYSETVTGTLCARSLRAVGVQEAESNHLITYSDISHTLNAGGQQRNDYETETFVCKATSEAGLSDVTMSITASYGRGGADLATKPLVLSRLRVRRLLPIECERLQGFPDNYTDIPWPRGSDGNRYKALGNSKAVPCIQWVGLRLLFWG